MRCTWNSRRGVRTPKRPPAHSPTPMIALLRLMPEDSSVRHCSSSVVGPTSLRVLWAQQQGSQVALKTAERAGRSHSRSASAERHSWRPRSFRSGAPLDLRRCLSRLRLPSINLPAPVAPMGRWLVQERLVGLPSWGPGGKAHILVVGPHRHSLHCGGGHGCRWRGVECPGCKAWCSACAVSRLPSHGPSIFVRSSIPFSSTSRRSG